MQVLPSAYRHGVTHEEMLHALNHTLAIEDIGEEPDRWLVIGPNHAGRLLELVVIVTDEGESLVIHAMQMRPQFRRLLP